MPKALGDIGFIDLLPESIKSDSTIQAAAQALDGEIQAVNSLLDVPTLLARLDELPEQAVDLLAWQFHVDFWDADIPLQEKRNLVQESIAWHKHKGTPWAVKHLLSKTGFTDVEIIEYWQAKGEYIDAGGARLDGTWALGGSSLKRLIPYESVIGLPYMGCWAEFCVKLNLAESRWPGWNEDLIRAVNVAKPARSWPVWLYWLYLVISTQPQHAYSLKMNKTVELDYPWCTPQLDSSWILGSGGYPYSLDGALQVNGCWSVGGNTQTVAGRQLRQCNILARLALRKNLSRSERHLSARLGESKLFLNGGWQVGLNRVFPLSNALLCKDICLEEQVQPVARQSLYVDLDYPSSPQSLGARPKLGTWRSLDGKWALSRTTRGVRLSGAWPVVGKPGVSSCCSAGYAIFGSIGPTFSLGSYSKIGQHWDRRLDGSWYVGARHDLDGTWPLRTGYLLGAQKVGQHFLGLDGSWKLGHASKKLGGFAVGRPGVECEARITVH